MAGRGWRMYAIALVAAVAIFVPGPRSPWWEILFQVPIGPSCGAAILVGIRGLPRAERVPWWFLTAAVLCTCTAPLPDQLGTDWFPGDGPDIADYLFLAFYPLMATGLTLMLRTLHRRTDWAALVDALTVTVGIGLLAWVYAIEPAWRDSAGGSPLSRLVTVAYPVADLALLALTILLLRSSGRRAPFWIGVSLGGYLTGDCAWVLLFTLNSDWGQLWWTGRLINALYMLSLLVLALAAARPDFRDHGTGAAAVSRLSLPQLTLLTGAVLISPVLLVAQDIAGRVEDAIAIAIGSAIMFLLVVTRMAQLLKQAERQQQAVHELSRRDELTGLPNRRAWTDELPRILERARADHTPVAIAMIDLDRFKLFNDRYGHPAGDRLLKEATAAWHSALRRSDVLARYGGEEFIAVLPGVDVSQAIVVLERLRLVTPQDQTFSAGVATWDGTETSDQLIARADLALYAAKNAGRDRICDAAALPTARL
ncbi:GGDEF domain-containing protein [Winogradskya consettensis]|nr:GGDEF domain-containing protein [Actinoplanes consettensis]